MKNTTKHILHEKPIRKIKPNIFYTKNLNKKYNQLLYYMTSITIFD